MSKAGALIVTEALKAQIHGQQNFIVVANPYLAFAILTHVFERKHAQTGIESTAQEHRPLLRTPPILGTMRLLASIV